MSDDDAAYVIVCVPADWNHTADSVLIDGTCGHQVWIAPSSKHKIDTEPGGLIKCIPCLVADPPPADTEFGVLRGSLEEIDKHEGEAARGRAERLAKRLGFRTL